MATAAVSRADVSLVQTVESGDREAALILIKQGADVNARALDGSTALHWAVHQGDADLVKRLLRAGADASSVNDYSATAMMEAATIGNAAIIKMLLEAGADPDSPNPEGQTALMAVARTGNVEAARSLLDAGADVNATERWGGQSALMWAAAQRQPEMVKELVTRGADVDARSQVRDWQRRVTAEPRIKDLPPGGFTPLLYAAREGCVECARHLVEGGADIDLTDSYRVTPLVLAILNTRYDVAAYLISAGADVNKWDWWGRTPIYAAVDMNILPAGGRTDLPSLDQTSALQVAEMLLEAGADPNLRLKNEPPLRNAVFDRGGDSQVLTVGATPLLRAAKAGDNAAIRLLLKHGARVEAANYAGITPLMTAAGVGHGSNPTRGRYKTEAEALESLELLLAAGADIKARDGAGQTALHGAARKGWTQVAKYLIDRGADPVAADAQGLTPLDYAMGKVSYGNLDAGQRHEETVALLERYVSSPK
jgi:ankyrin